MRGLTPTRAVERWKGILPDAASLERELPALSAEDYERALQDAARDLEASNGVLAAACFGQASLPGVSDLDLLIVCRDASYADIRALCALLQASRPDILVHQPFVLPASLTDLRPVLFFEQTFNPHRVIAGDGSLLKPAPPSSAVRTLSVMTWGSTVWRVVREARSIRTLRPLLLLLQTVARQSALTMLSLGREDEMQLLLKRWNDRRNALKGAEAYEVVETLAEALEGLEGLERELQESVMPENKASCEYGPLALPGYYARLQGIWGQLLPGLPAEPAPLLHDLERAAAETVLPAVHRALAWGLEHGGDPYALFLGRGGIFPSPFNALPDASGVPRGG